VRKFKEEYETVIKSFKQSGEEWENSYEKIRVQRHEKLEDSATRTLELALIISDMRFILDERSCI
jgi:hypothetical protein